MSGGYTRGPWEICKCSKPQAGDLNWYVARQNFFTEPHERTEWELFTDEAGMRTAFVSEEAARAAIAKATGSAA